MLNDILQKAGDLVHRTGIKCFEGQVRVLFQVENRAVIGTQDVLRGGVFSFKERNEGHCSGRHRQPHSFAVFVERFKYFFGQLRLGWGCFLVQYGDKFAPQAEGGRAGQTFDQVRAYTLKS